MKKEKGGKALSDKDLASRAFEIVMGNLKEEEVLREEFGGTPKDTFCSFGICILLSVD